MKVGVIGDIHGRDNWKYIIQNNPEVEQWIFLGDYTDSFNFSNIEILHNLLQIIAYAEANPNTILLIGNHDYQYIAGRNGEFVCSGFRPEAYTDLNHTFRSNRSKFRFAYEKGGYLFSHAGITKKWWKEAEELYHDYLPPEIGVVDCLNYTLDVGALQEAMWEVGPARGGWLNSHGSPIWADQQETRFGCIPGYIHVVGHTPQKSGVKYFKTNGEDGIYYCDAIEHVTKNHLILEIY